MSEQLQAHTEEVEHKEERGKGVVRFLQDVLRGALIGIAFIIPGFSGGSVAAILGIYERLVGAIADIFKDFKHSVKTLFPFAIGLILGVAALIFPLRIALEYAPIPTVCLFVGLALGGMFSITDKVKGKIQPLNLASLLIPLAAAFSLSFLPLAGEVDLFALDFWGFVLLFIIGLVGSCALVVPGISGSMLLLIFGYYNPIVQLITDHLLRFQNVGWSILVLCVVGLGILVGFFLISLLMKWLLKKYPRGTYFAIIGFILGSIPTVFISTAKDAGKSILALLATPWDWIAAILLLLVGFIGAFAFVVYSRKAEKKKEENKDEV